MTAFYRFLLHIVFILFRYTIPCRQSSSIQDAISADGAAAQANPLYNRKIMRRFAEAMAEVANVERQPKLEGRTMLMFLAPKPAK